MIKKLWAIAGSPKIDSKAKIKAITLTRLYYRERLGLVGYEQSLIHEVKRMDDAKRSSSFRKQL